MTGFSFRVMIWQGCQYIYPPGAWMHQRFWAEGCDSGLGIYAIVTSNTGMLWTLKTRVVVHPSYFQIRQSINTQSLYNGRVTRIPRIYEAYTETYDNGGTGTRNWFSLDDTGRISVKIFSWWRGKSDSLSHHTSHFWGRAWTSRINYPPLW